MSISYRCCNLIVTTLLLISLLLLGACGDEANPQESGATPTEYTLYQDGLAAYRAGDYAAAVSLFGDQLTRFPSGNYADDGLLYQGRAYYWLSRYEVARDNFLKILSEFGSGDRTDSAQYWLGKAHHALGEYSAARLAYSMVDPAGQWLDNAAMQIGRTYYDEADTVIESAAAYALLDTAVTLLNDMLGLYPTSSAVDDAQYYLGRSHQQQAELLLDTPSLAQRLSIVAFADARAAYALVSGTSIYADDALYFTGRSYHEQLPADYASARDSYQNLVDMATSGWSDDAKYQIGKTYYDEAVDSTDPALSYTGFTTAISHFNEIITVTSPVYQLSNRADSSRYYNGRALHRQALLLLADAGLSANSATELFAMAYNAYQALLDFDPLSNWSDNAMYQQAAVHHDQATDSFARQDYVATQIQLSSAILKYRELINHTIYANSNSADNSLYNLGRCYQLANDIPEMDRMASNGIDFSQVTLDDARVHFLELITNSLYSASSWIDNARFEIAETYRIDAQNAVVTAEQETAYNNALSYYASVVNDYPLSIRVDNSSYQIAVIYHDTGYCTEEQDWFSYLETLSTASTTYLDEAAIHLADLVLATPSQHVCGAPTLSSISVVTHP